MQKHSLRWDQILLILLALVLLALSQTPILHVLQNLFVFFAILAVLQATHTFFFARSLPPFRIAKSALYCGLISTAIDILRISFQPSFFSDLTAIILNLPLLTISAVSVILLIQRSRNYFGKIWMPLLLLLPAIFRDSQIAVFTILLILAQTPFSWLKLFSQRQILRLAALGLILLLANQTLMLMKNDPQILTPEAWSLAPDAIYAGSATMIRAFAWTCLLAGLLYPLRPQSIRTRLRYAFLLNFIIPFTLLMILSVFSVLLLVGGYQIASAKRLIFQIGDQAQGQAFQLWETIHGTSREAPARSPFRRAGVVMFEDGSIQEFGEPPFELVDKLSNTSNTNMEFITVESPSWELWLAGFHRAPDQSGAVIAYRMDQIMLDYIQEVIGFDLVLSPGLDWRFLPFMPSKPNQGQIATFDLSADDQIQRYPIGAILLSALKPKESNEEAESLLINPFATLKVLANRQTLSQSLLMVSNLSKMSILFGPNANSPISITDFNGRDIEKEAQSVNILGIIIFVLLSVVAGFFVALIFISLSMSFFLSRKINRSVRLIREGTTQLRKGNLDHQIPVITTDELGELAFQFNEMASSLRNYQKEREQFILQEIEQERLRSEFETAHLLQKSLLPIADPVLSYVSVSGSCDPVAEVGGDYFDYLIFQDGAFGLAIGDVSGHGMSAGILMSMAKSCLYNQVRISSSVRDVIRSLNSMVYEALKQKLLMTFLYAIFTRNGRQLSFASAGHHFPYLLRHGTSELLELESVAYPLGVRDDIQIQEIQVNLSPKDILIFYTDGIVETQNPFGEQFGFKRFEQAIIELADQPAGAIRKMILSKISDFRAGAPLIDDITLLVVQIQDDGNGSS